MKRALVWAGYTTAAILPLALMLGHWTDLTFPQIVAVWIAVSWFAAMDARLDQWDRLYVMRRRWARYRDTNVRPRFDDAGQTTIGQAIGAVLVLGVFLVLYGLCGSIETAGVTP